MKQSRRSLMSCLIAFTMVFMSSFSNLFAMQINEDLLNVKSIKALATDSALKTTISALKSEFKFSGDVFVIGDSTACEYPVNTVISLDRQGWGMRLGEYFNKDVKVHNLALSGRSSKSYVSEGYYTKLLNELGKGDYLFIQFAHNDQKNTDEKRYTVPGLDYSTLDAEGKNPEGISSFEWYLIEKYIKPALERGAMPVLLTPITRRASSGGANVKAHVPYQEAILNIATAYELPSIDMTSKTAALYTQINNEGGAEATAKLHAIKLDSKTNQYITDNTHLSAKGSKLVSGLVVEGIKEAGLALKDSLKTQESDSITIHLVGDSTVKTYESNQFLGGWGEFLHKYFDGSKVTIRNYAEGGRSARSFINEGRLVDNGKFTTDMAPKGMGPISENLKEGDYLFIQFGHNDDNSKGYTTMYDRMIPLGEPDENGIYPTTPGEMTTINELPQAYLDALDQAGLSETDKQAAIDKALKAIAKYGDTTCSYDNGEKYYAYDCGGTYKWFLKQYIDFARDNGVTPVLVTPVSRRNFDENGKIVSKAGHHGGSDMYHDFRYVAAMRQLAEEENVILIDLFAQTKAFYETLGEKTSEYIQGLKDAKGSRLDGVWVSEYNDYIKNGGYSAYDNTHQNKFGSELFTAMLIEQLMANKDVVKGVEGQKESITALVGAMYTVPTEYGVVPDALVSSLGTINDFFKVAKPIAEGLIPGETKPGNTGSSSHSNSKKDEGIIMAGKNEAATNETTAKVYFNDLSGSIWAKDAINRFAELGFIKGYPNGNFAPKKNISRADFSMITAHVLGLKGEAKVTFTDVKADKYYANSVALMTEAGYVAGMANNSFKPEDHISRQDAMCIMARVLEKHGKLNEGNSVVLNQFKDAANISDYAKANVAALVELGIITGVDSKINPKANITRAEVCVMLERVYDLLN